MAPKLDFAPRVTIAHGRRFAQEWLTQSRESESPYRAFGSTRLIAWPGETDPLALARYDAIEDEILSRVFHELRAPVAAAFARIAGEVIARERQRRTNGA